MRDRKNINKFALSHEKVLISGYGNGSLPAHLPFAAVTFMLLSGVGALRGMRSWLT
jgi:hypothetical protein